MIHNWEIVVIRGITVTVAFSCNGTLLCFVPLVNMSKIIINYLLI